MNPLPAPLLMVTDRHQARAPIEQIVRDVVEAGARWIWFRDRDLPTDSRRHLARTLLQIVRSAGACLSVGGDVALAADIEADGVHVQSAAAVADARARLGPRALIGVSAHSIGHVQDAASAAADYVTFSPIFTSSSKPAYGPPLGTAAIGHAARFGVPVLALGGVTPVRVADCRRSGAAGVAMMGDVMRAENPARLVWDVLRALEEGSASMPPLLRLRS